MHTEQKTLSGSLPFINYCNVVQAGGYKTKLRPLQLIQKRILRIICGDHYIHVLEY